jgi:hypothetical protein
MYSENQKLTLYFTNRIVKPRKSKIINLKSLKVIMIFITFLKSKMPFKLEKISENKYYVITKDSGRRHSLHPLTHDKARAQLYVLEKLYEEGKLK